MFKKIILIHVAIFCTTTFAASFNMQQAVQAAVQHNLQIKQAEQVVLQKKYAKHSTLANFTPQISASYSYVHINSPLTIDLSPIRGALMMMQANTQTELANLQMLMQAGVPLTAEQRAAYYNAATTQLDQLLPEFSEQLKAENYHTATLTAVQPLFMGGKLIAAQKAARADAEAAEFARQQTQNEIVQQTIEQYLTLLMLDESIHTREQVLLGMQKHERAANSLFEQGLLTKDQTLRAKVAVAEAEKNLANDQRTRQTAVLAFCQTVGLAADEPIFIAEKFNFHPVTDSLSWFCSHAQVTQPILHQLAKKHKMAQQQVVATRADFLPQVAGFGKYELYPEYLSAIEPRWVVGVQAQYTLFHGAQKYNDLQQAKHVEKQVSYIEKDAAEQIQLWVTNSYQQMRNYEKEYQQLENNIALAEECLLYTSKRFSTGLSTSLEVIDAELLLEKAQLEQLAALYAYYQSATALLTAVGKPTDMLKLWAGQTDLLR